MSFFQLRMLRPVMMVLASILSLNAFASGGGIALNATRVIYPKDAKQATITVRNTSGDATYLVQSWVENKDGNKTKDFMVTPPLYSSAAGNENALRLIYAGAPLPDDRESVFYLNVKGIPSINKSASEGQNTLILAAVTKIKVFVRPKGLPISSDAAQNKLEFTRQGSSLKVTNPTPYYLSLTNIKVDGKPLASAMMPPKSDSTLILPSAPVSELTFNTVNDYGAVTPVQKIKL